MATVTIRNLDEGLVQAVKRQAKAHNRSLEAELREIVAQHVEQTSKLRKLRDAARRIAARTPVQTTDSVDLLRESRKERGG